MKKPKSQQEWIMLVHQLPANPTSLRLRVWRRLQSFGAASIKNSVYVLPLTDKTKEDLQWLKQDIEESGGEASLFQSASIEGTTDDELIAVFWSQQNEKYEKLILEFKDFGASLVGLTRTDLNSAAKFGQLETELERLRRELGIAIAVDFFNAPKGKKTQTAFEACQKALQRLKSTNSAGASNQNKPTKLNLAEFQNRRWVTRRNPHIDRLACGWLIKRFIDKRPRFGFVNEGDSIEGSVSFDMVGGDFTHRGEDCSFETLIKGFGLATDLALRQIAEIVHDIDLKDNKFNRLEANGVNTVIQGLSALYGDDNERLRNAFAVFDGLYRFFSSSKTPKQRIGKDRKIAKQKAGK